MQIITSCQQTISDEVCLMVGNYDGIHLGHQAIITQAKELARSHNLKTAVLSFEPHPLKVLAPSRAPKLLHTLEQKRLLLEYYQVDYYVEQQFDEAFSQLSPEAFILHLRTRIPFRFILVGFNFHFGHQRAGDFKTLETLGQRFGFQAIKQEAVKDESGPISSSRIRAQIKEGKTLEAARLLNRPYFLDGVVVPGAQIGRKIESPTANFVAANQLLPRFGVYASWAMAEKKWYRAITNVGAAPTVDRGELIVETLLFDFSGELYQKHLVICLGQFLRPETRFANTQLLGKQIQEDIRNRKALADIQPPDFALF